MNVEDIDINKIKQVENIRLRITEEDVSSLMSSIKQDGLLEPIGVVRDTGKRDEYLVLYGNRRLEACRKLGWKTIPANVSNNYVSFTDFIIKNTMENVEREQISESELGRIFHQLKFECNMTESEIASRFSISNSRVKSVIEIYSRIPEEYQSKIKYNMLGKKKGNIPAKSADIIINMRRRMGFNKESMVKLLELCRQDNFSTSHLEIVGALLTHGFDIDEAVKLAKEYTVVSIKLPLLKKELNEKKKKHKKSVRWIISNIVSGKLNESFDVPWFEVKALKKNKVVPDIKISNGTDPLIDSGSVVKDAVDEKIKKNWSKFSFNKQKQ